MNIGEIKLTPYNAFDGDDETGCHDDIFYAVLQKVSDEGYPDEQVRTLFESRNEEKAQAFYNERMQLNVLEFNCSQCYGWQHNDWTERKYGKNAGICCDNNDVKMNNCVACQLFRRRK